MPRSVAASSGAKDSAYGLSAEVAASCPVVSSRNSGGHSDETFKEPSMDRMSIASDQSFGSRRPSPSSTPGETDGEPVVPDPSTAGWESTFSSKPLPGPCASATSSPLPAWERSESAPEPSSNEGSPACGETSPEDTLASKEPAYAIAEKGIIVTISKNAMNTLKSRSGNVRGVIRCAFFINFLTSLPHETSIAFIPSRSAISSNATYQ